MKMYEDKTCSVSEILKVTGISKETLYKYIRQYNLHS
ncbi:MAG: helix-turn-helix domain-containing protein [Paludibacteraceae bacterium]|nr:helix-turn-helix domain-containing protein [Paludibacteraceae bacterium]